MGIYDTVSDVPGQLKAEGLNMTVTFEPGVPHLGQGTVKWNIPGPVVETIDANGNITITADPTGKPVAYSGIVFVLRNKPLDITNIPKDGVKYVADPTADPTIFSGDKIGDGFVIGAFYEGTEKAQGKPLTTSFVLNDVEEDAPYYICGYIVDDQLRYYEEGMRTYSQDTGNVDGIGDPARQVVQLQQLQTNTQPSKYGVKPTDGTGLVAGATYQFELIYDSNYPKSDPRDIVRMFFSFDGSVAPTYGDLIKYLNEQIAIKCTNAIQSPVPPNAGVYYWDATNKKLYYWNGSSLSLVPNVIVQDTDPANPPLGSYWWNTTDGKLYIWDGYKYVLVVPQVAFPVDPTTITEDAYWWNGVNGFTRCGNTWCETTTIVSTTDPSCPITPVQCAYWYDTDDGKLYKWDSGQWIQAYALMWGDSPTALPDETFWFDLDTNHLFERDSHGPIGSFGNMSHGTGYVPGTYTNVNLIGGHGSGAQATVVVSNTIVTAPVTTGGSGYNSNPAPLDEDFHNVPLTGGTGTGAKATIRVVSGTVIQVTITDGGVGYTVNDVLSANNAFLGGTGSGFTATVATVTGGVQSVTLTAQGSNYIFGDILSAVGSDLGSALGTGFAAEVVTLGSGAVNTWIQRAVTISETDPAVSPGAAPGEYWYTPSTEVLRQRDPSNTIWNTIPVLVWAGDPTNVESCELWWDESVNPAQLYQWDWAHSVWNLVVAFYQQATDPYAPPVLETGTLWWNPSNNTLLLWNGSSWQVINFFTTPGDPTIPLDGSAWLNTTTQKWYIWNQPNPGWNLIDPTISAVDPSMIPQGYFWFDTSTNILYQRVGVQWVPIPYVTVPPSNTKGQTWYNLTTHKLMEWNGKAWVPAVPCVFVKLEFGQLVFQSTGRGSNNVVLIPVPPGVPNNVSPCLIINSGQVDYVNDSNSPYQNYPLGGFGNSYNCYCQFQTPGREKGVRYTALPINPQAFLFAHLKPMGGLLFPQVGRDGVDGTPSYDQLGVGTTGSPAERRQLMSEVQTLLGATAGGVTVELNETQLDLCVTNALRVFRQRSSLAYKRAAFFLDIVPYKQNYILADKAVGFNKIVNVMAGYRFTSAFLSSAYGAGVYGQVVLQHLYNMGTFDLLSYHLVSQYVENLEILFSTRLVFVFDETSRQIQFFESFNRPERVLLDATIEKTEQEIFQNRYAHHWIQQFALAEACEILANIRGKYGSLPGAGGSVQLNASDLRAQANDIRTRCQEAIDDYTVQNVEDYGAYGSIAIG